MKKPLADLSEPEPDLDFASIIRMLQRRKRIFITCFLLAIAASLLFILHAKPVYRAMAQLQLLGEDTPTTIADVSSGSFGPEDAIQVNLTLQTYAGIIESDNIALRVIREQHLEETPEFKTTPGRFATSDEKAELGAPLEQTRYRRTKVLAKFKKSLSVSVVSGSKLLSVGFDSPNPNLAQRVLNQLLADFVDYNFEVRFNAVSRSDNWLNRRLVDLKAEVQQSQEEAVKLQRETGIFGPDQSQNLVLGRLQALDQEYISAEQNRIVKQSVLDVVRGGNPEAISNLSGTTGQSMTPGSTNSLALIQTLRQQQATLETQDAELSSRYGPNFPRVEETRKELAAIKESIAEETTRLRQRAANDYRAAEIQENAIRKALDDQKAVANKANDLAIQYTIANREATSNRDLYQQILQKAKEGDVLAGLRSTNIDIVDSAYVSPLPVRPKPLLILGIGIGAGSFLGLCAVFLTDSLDHSLYDPEDVQRLTGIKLLGLLPKVKKDAKDKDHAAGDSAETSGKVGPSFLYRYASTHPDSAYTEALRIVRTSIATPESDRRRRIILVTSPIGGEGKTAVAANLAEVLAQQAHRVLLVDADLRKCTLSDALGFGSVPGLSESIDKKQDIEPQLLPGNGALYFVPCGSKNKFPGELVASEWLQKELASWRDTFDYVVVDAASALNVADVSELSRRVDVVIMVVKAGATSKQALIRAAASFTGAEDSVVGAVMNEIDPKSSEYKYYFGI